MKAVTMCLTVVAIALLGVIAYDLHRVATVLSVTTGIGDTGPALTREERIRLLRERDDRMIRDFRDEFAPSRKAPGK